MDDVRFAHPTIDRIWLGLVALSFLFIAPLWLYLSLERYGWRMVLVCLALALVWRYRPSPE